MQRRIISAFALILAACSSNATVKPQDFSVTGTTPADGAHSVATNAAIAVSFNRAPDPATLTDANVTFSPATAGAWSVSGIAAVFTPAAALQANTTYTVTLGTSVKAPDGKALALPYSFGFTTSAAADTTPPGAVADLAASATSSTTATVSWTATGNDGTTGTAAAYDLRYLAAGACPITSANFTTGTQIATGAPQASGAAESALVTGLTADTDYCFLLKVADASANTSFSNEATVHTPASADTTAPDAAVLTTGTVNGSSVQLLWTEPGDDGMTGTATSQELRYLSGAACPIVAGNFASSTLVSGLGAPAAGGTAVTFTVTGLTAETAYCFALKVSDEAGNASLSNSASATTQDGGAPGTPVLNHGTVSDNSVELLWADVGDDGNTGTATSQVIYMASGSDCATFNFANHGNVTVAGVPTPQAPGTAETVTASDLSADTDYCFLLVVTDNVGFTGQSNILTVHTVDDVAPDAAELADAGVTESSVAVSWTETGDNGTSGKLASDDLRYGAVCPENDGSTFSSGTSVALDPVADPGTQRTATVSGLLADTDYCLVLRSADEAGNAAFSEPLTLHTLALQAPLAEQLDVQADSLSTDGMVIEWTSSADDGGNGGAVAAQQMRSMTGAACADFSVESFDDGTLVEDTPTPGAPGTPQSVDLRGSLAADTDYCFIMKVTGGGGLTAFSGKLSVHTVDSVAPATPALTGAAVGATVTLHWTAVGDNGSFGTAASYTLLVQTEGSTGVCPGSAAGFASPTVLTSPGDLSAPKPAGSQEAFVLQNAQELTTYCFALRASDEAGNDSPYSAVLKIDVSYADITPPPAVTDMTAVIDSSTHVRLAWTSPGQGAVSYDVRRASGSACPITAGSFATATPVTDTAAAQAAGATETLDVTLADTNAAELCFAVRSQDAAHNVSDVSNSAVPPARIIDLAQTGTPADENDGFFGWTAVGDDFRTGTAASYGWWFKAAAGTCPSEPADMLDGAINETGGVLPAPASAGTHQTGTLAALTRKTSYCVTLQVTDSAGNASYSNVVQLTTPDQTPPATIQPLTLVAAADTRLDIGLTAVGDDGTTGAVGTYQLSYTSGAGCAAGFNYDGQDNTKLLYSFAPIPAGTQFSVPMQNLVPGTHYCIEMTATDAAGNRSAPPAAPFEANTTGTIDTTPPPAVADLTSIIENGTVVTLNWTGPDDGNETPAQSYDIRYALGQSCPISDASFGSATQVSKPPTPTLGGDTVSVTLEDTGAQELCFALKSTDAAGNVSALSNVSIPPGRVLDLGVDGTTETTADLVWTAPGADFDAGGPAAHYYFEIVPVPTLVQGGGGQNGDTINPCTGDPSQLLTAPGLVEQGPVTPSDPGSPEAHTITGLNGGNTYCVALFVDDHEGNVSLSNVATVVTPDNTPPAPVQPLDTDAATTRSITIGYATTGDDGTTGAAISYELQYRRLPQEVAPQLAFVNACVGFFSYDDPSNVKISIPQVVPPVPAGQHESVLVTGLLPGTAYCFQMSAVDDAGNRSQTPSNGIYEGFTNADTTPPGQITILEPQPGDFTSNGGYLRWLAPADDGFDASSGPANAYDVRWLNFDGESCDDGLYGDAYQFNPEPGVSAGPGQPDTVFVSDASNVFSQAVCIAAEAIDLAGNRSQPSNWLLALDDTPPARVTNLAAAHGGDSTAVISFTKVGDDGSSQTASSYDLRAASGACPSDATDFFNNVAQPVDNVPSPTAPPGTESFSVSTFDAAQTYCFALVVYDAAGNTSPVSNLAELNPDPAVQIAVIRSAIQNGSGPGGIALGGLHVSSAVVTYLKAAFGGAADGTADGRGFFIEAASGGAGLFFAMDPTGHAVGDVVSVTATTGAWTGCGGATCTNANSVYAVTAASFTTLSTGAALPAAVDLSTTDLSSALGANWTYGGSLVKFTGTAAAFSASTQGFAKSQLTGAGAGKIFLRIGDTVFEASSLAAGCTLTVTSPGWRTGTEAEVGAWAATDIQASGCPAPAVASITPANATTSVSETTSITLNFNVPVKLSSLAAQGAPGIAGTASVCDASKSVLISDTATFTNCVGVSVTGGVASAFNTSVTLAPSLPLTAGKTYFVKVVGAKAGDVTTLTTFASTGFTVVTPTAGVCASNAPVVISQAYLGGGNSGATYTNDFLELHNRTGQDIDISGWTIEYASQNGSFSSVGNTLLPAGTVVKAGAYYTVQELSGGVNGVAISPTPDYVPASNNALNFSATAGKIALVRAGTQLTSSCPLTDAHYADVVDFVTWGSVTAGCFEGAISSSSAPPNTNSLQRKLSGNQDNNDTKNDFSSAAAAPRNASTAALAANSCQGNPAQTEDETNAGAEADYCANIASAWYTDPQTIVVGANQTTLAVFGQIYEGGVTPGGNTGAVIAQLGYGPATVNPATQSGWIWSAATFNGQRTNNLEYTGTLTAPSVPGAYKYTFRFSLDNGVSWTYCDKDGAGSNPNLDFNFAQVPLLTVQ